MTLRKSISAAALVFALAAGSVIIPGNPAIAPAAAAAKAPAVSAKFGKPLSEAQKLITEGKMDEAAAKLAEIVAMPDPSPYDSYVISQFKLNIAAKKNDFQGAAAAFEEMLKSEFMPEDQKPSAYKVIMQVANSNKNYAKALAAADAYTEKFGDDPDILVQAGQALYFLDRNREASARIQKAIRAKEAKGGPVDKSWYDLWVSADLKAGGNNNEAARAAVTERLLKFHAKEDWMVLIDLAQRAHKNFTDTEFAEFYRLNWLTDTLDSREYSSAGRLLIGVKLFGDATALLQKGVNAGYVTGADAALLAKAKSEMAKDKAVIDQIAAAAKTSPNGIGLLNVSKAYRNYDQPQKAVEFAKAALAKGGLKSVEDARLQLAIAEMASGDKASAQTEFEALAKTNTPAGSIAQLYALYNR